MSQANAVAVLQPPQGAQIVAMDDWTETRINFVIQNYCGGAPEATAAAFIQVARKRRLSPEEKQIYLIKRGDKWGVETSIDGYRLIADRTGAYAGSDVPIFGATIDGHPESASVTVYKIVQGTRVPFTAVAYWEEFAPVGNQAFMWAKMPRHMLAKVAEAQALRKAFPADLSGIYVSEEMHQAEDDPRPITVRDVTPKGTGAAPKAVAAGDAARSVTAKRLYATIREKFGKDEDAGAIGHDLVCIRFGLDSTKEATTEQLREAVGAVESWSASWAPKAMEWLGIVAQATTPTMVADVALMAEDQGVDDPYVLAALRVAQERYPIPDAAEVP